MTSRIMGDSANYEAIPTDVAIAAFYDDGSFAVSQAAFAQRFPRNRYGWCVFDVNGTRPDADARDWEPGNYPDPQSLTLQTWVIAHNKASGKKDAVVYCDRADVPHVRVATGSQILGTDYFLLISTLDGTVVTAGPEHLESPPFTYPGVIGCQLKGAKLTGGNWDESLIYDGSLFLPVKPAPPKPKPPVVTAAQAKAALSQIVAGAATLAVYVSEG